MKKQKEDIVVYDLLRTYHKEGEYCIKVVLNGSIFKINQEIEVEMYDPDRNMMEVDVRKWGRKFYCHFKIDNTTSDGVSILKIFVKKKNKLYEKVCHYWIIK